MCYEHDTDVHIFKTVLPIYFWVFQRLLSFEYKHVGSIQEQKVRKWATENRKYMPYFQPHKMPQVAGHTLSCARYFYGLNTFTQAPDHPVTGGTNARKWIITLQLNHFSSHSLFSMACFNCIPLQPLRLHTIWTPSRSQIKSCMQFSNLPCMLYAPPISFSRQVSQTTCKWQHIYTLQQGIHCKFGPDKANVKYLRMYTCQASVIYSR